MNEGTPDKGSAAVLSNPASPLGGQSSPKNGGITSGPETPPPSTTSSQQRKKEIKLNNRYLLKSKLGGGSFGEIYRGIDTVTQKEIAVKMEPARSRNAQLQYESRVYKLLLTTSSSAPAVEIIGVPQVYWFGQEDHFNAMVMELCGPCIEDLFNYCLRSFSLKTVMMLGIQMLHRLEFIHKKGIIHRDIKPENFVFGLSEKGHVLQIIDFGLCKRFYDVRARQHIAFRDGKPLTGTARYCSANAHRGYEQSRRDDLESIGYLMIYFFLGQLPWQGISAPDAQTKTAKIGERKMKIPLEELCKDAPPVLLQYMKYVKALEFTQDPDYEYMRTLLLGAIEDSGKECDWVFDWYSKRDGEIQTCNEISDDGSIGMPSSELMGFRGSIANPSNL